MVQLGKSKSRHALNLWNIEGIYENVAITNSRLSYSENPMILKNLLTENLFEIESQSASLSDWWNSFVWEPAKPLFWDLFILFYSVVDRSRVSCLIFKAWFSDERVFAKGINHSWFCYNSIHFGGIAPKFFPSWYQLAGTTTVRSDERGNQAAHHEKELLEMTWWSQFCSKEKSSIERFPALTITQRWSVKCLRHHSGSSDTTTIRRISRTDSTCSIAPK